MAKIINDIQPRGIASAYVIAPFDEGMEALQKKGYALISLEDNAQLRIQEGKDADIARNGNWVREGVLRIPQKGIFLTKRSPMLAHAQEATQCHRKGQDYYLTNEQVEQALEGAVGITEKIIPTNDFKNHPLTVSAFVNHAEAYGQFLQEAGITNMLIYASTSETQDKPFVRQLWFWGLGLDSVLGGDGRNLGCDLRVRGVQKGAVGTAKNIEVYTTQQLKQALNHANIPGLEQTILAELRKQ